MKIIATLTTLPSRIEFLEPVLESMLTQTRPPDEIHLQLPALCKKENIEYRLPDFIHSMDKIKIQNHPHDFGPATKWLPALRYLQGEEVLLLIMDDDCFYPETMVEQLLIHAESDSSKVYCSTGGILSGPLVQSFEVQPEPKENSLTIITENEKLISVDTVQGFSLILFNTQLIDFSLIQSLEHEEVLPLADDILLSSLFEILEVERIQVAPYQVPQPLDQAEINPIHGKGNLSRMSLNTFLWTQKRWNLWPDYTFKMKKKSFPKKVRDKLKSMIK